MSRNVDTATSHAKLWDMAGTPTIWTIGYEKASQDSVIAALRAAGIRTLLDVRELPLSRRAGFSKSPLRAGLAEAGIGYVHLKGLGTPAEGRMAGRMHDHERFWAIVERRMETPEAEADLQRAAAIAREEPACLLCVEADPCVCHRLRVAQLLAERFGFAVEHLHPVLSDGARR
ncbi:DUF488 domain-containing protein [Azospirillum sp. TSO22-1]|uniref:DUF488 domain-containing protein n=1 Tax=Azospirillum sp. TSO22-1 TaxID=716789 RepID=UPI001FFF0F41|nr:DUF488 domain-containing protein [Azospirillum sp. TSO22-1]